MHVIPHQLFCASLAQPLDTSYDTSKNMIKEKMFPKIRDDDDD